MAKKEAIKQTLKSILRGFKKLKIVVAVLTALLSPQQGSFTSLEIKAKGAEVKYVHEVQPKAETRACCCRRLPPISIYKGPGLLAVKRPTETLEP